MSNTESPIEERYTRIGERYPRKRSRIEERYPRIVGAVGGLIGFPIAGGIPVCIVFVLLQDPNSPMPAIVFGVLSALGFIAGLLKPRVGFWGWRVVGSILSSTT